VADPVGVAGGAAAEAAACAWVKANPAVWQQWAPTAPACSAAHYSFAVGACSENCRVVAARWNRPRSNRSQSTSRRAYHLGRAGAAGLNGSAAAAAADAAAGLPESEECVGGLPLPPSFDVPCETVPSGSGLHQSVVGLVALLLALWGLAAAFIIIKGDHECFHLASPALLLGLCLGCVFLLMPPLLGTGVLTGRKCDLSVALLGLGVVMNLCHFSIRAEYLLSRVRRREGESNSTVQKVLWCCGCLLQLVGAAPKRNAVRMAPKPTTWETPTKNGSQEKLRVHNKIRGISGPEASGPQTGNGTDLSAAAGGRDGSRRGGGEGSRGGGGKGSSNGKESARRQQLNAFMVTAGGKIVGDEALQAAQATLQLMQFAGFCAVELLLLLVRLSVAPSEARVSVIAKGGAEYTSSRCATPAGGEAAVVVYWAYKVLVLLYAFYKNNLAEKSGLMFDRCSMHAIYNVAGWGTALFCFTHFSGAQAKPSDRYLVYSVSLLCGSCGMLALMIAPRLHVFWYGDKKKVRVLSQSYLIPYEDLTLLKPIGGGSFSDVLKGKYKQTQVAIKRLRGKISESQVLAFGKEVVMMAELHHPNVVMMMGFCAKPPLLVMEFLGRGSLYRVLHATNIALDWSMVFNVLCDTACGMSYLHAHNPPVVHADLKTPNILVDMNWRCKITDFGLSKLKDSTMNSSKVSSAKALGSLFWCAPEVYQSKKVPVLCPLILLL
jgi:hypothetical protein